MLYILIFWNPWGAPLRTSATTSATQSQLADIRAEALLRTLVMRRGSMRQCSTTLAHVVSIHPVPPVGDSARRTRASPWAGLGTNTGAAPSSRASWSWFSSWRPCNAPRQPFLSDPRHAAGRRAAFLDDPRACGLDLPGAAGWELSPVRRPWALSWA